MENRQKNNMAFNLPFLTTNSLKNVQRETKNLGINDII